MKASMQDCAQASELCIWPVRRYGSSIWRGPCSVYPNRFHFLPKDSCQRLLSYSALCIFSHNNWKHSCAGKKPIQRRYTAIIITAPQQRAKVSSCSRKLLFTCGEDNTNSDFCWVTDGMFTTLRTNKKQKTGIKNRRANDTCANILVITTQQPHLNEKKTWGFHKRIPK